MNAISSTEPSILDLAYRLLHEPTEKDLLRGPIEVGPGEGPSPTEAVAERAVHQTLGALIERLGPPSQYGGNTIGPIVRWHRGTHTVVVNSHPGGRLMLSVHDTLALEHSEADRFRTSSDRVRQGAASLSALPYLWRHQRHGSEAAAPHTGPLASDWTQLQASLKALLSAWCEQLEALVGDDDAGFNITHGDGGLLAVIVSARDDLSVYADGRVGADRDAAHLADMTARGWQAFTPGICCWDAHFERTAAGAAGAARLIVTELQLRGVATPGDLRLTQVSLGDDGRLDVPGSGIAVASSSR